MGDLKEWSMSNNKRAWSDAPGHVVMLVADVEIGLDAIVAEQYLRDLANAVNKANYRGYVIFDVLEKEKPSKWRAFWEGFSGMWAFRNYENGLFFGASIIASVCFFVGKYENGIAAYSIWIACAAYMILSEVKSIRKSISKGDRK